MLSAALVAYVMFAVGSADSAQQCPPALPSNAKAWFDFQVDTPAEYSGPATRMPYPQAMPAERPPYSDDFVLVQFIVDTSGVPAASTFRLLRSPKATASTPAPSVLARDSLLVAAATWRYTPAVKGGCRVPQLVQTPLRWK